MEGRACELLGMCTVDPASKYIVFGIGSLLSLLVSCSNDVRFGGGVNGLGRPSGLSPFLLWALSAIWLQTVQCPVPWLRTSTTGSLLFSEHCHICSQFCYLSFIILSWKLLLQSSFLIFAYYSNTEGILLLLSIWLFSFLILNVYYFLVYLTKGEVSSWHLHTYMCHYILFFGVPLPYRTTTHPFSLPSGWMKKVRVFYIDFLFVCKA